MQQLSSAVWSENLSIDYGVAFRSDGSYWTSAQASGKNNADANCTSFQNMILADCNKTGTQGAVRLVRARLSSVRADRDGRSGRRRERTRQAQPHRDARTRELDSFPTHGGC